MCTKCLARSLLDFLPVSDSCALYVLPNNFIIPCIAPINLYCQTRGVDPLKSTKRKTELKRCSSELAGPIPWEHSIATVHFDEHTNKKSARILNLLFSFIYSAKYAQNNYTKAILLIFCRESRHYHVKHEYGPILFAPATPGVLEIRQADFSVVVWAMPIQGHSIENMHPNWWALLIGNIVRIWIAGPFAPFRFGSVLASTEVRSIVHYLLDSWRQWPIGRI